MALCNYLEEGCSEEGVGHFFFFFFRWQVIRCKEIASSLTVGGLDWLSGRNSSWREVVKHWNRSPGEVLELPSLEVF